MQCYIINEQETHIDHSSLLELLVRRDDIVCIMTYKGTPKAVFTLSDGVNISLFHVEFKTRLKLDQFLKFNFEDWYAVEFDKNGNIQDVDFV